MSLKRLPLATCMVALIVDARCEGNGESSVADTRFRAADAQYCEPRLSGWVALPAMLNASALIRNSQDTARAKPHVPRRAMAFTSRLGPHRFLHVAMRDFNDLECRELPPDSSSG